ncbi:efflux RND transporter permease subunit [bacterium]|nr:efflux RND transporter permease subunit [bacterium]
MIDGILNFSIRYRGLACVLALVFTLGALAMLGHLPVDAVPDVTNRQVQLNTVSPALGAEEIERRVTFPLELALSGLPRVTEVRSISQFGLSQITLVFTDDTDIYFARQLVGERLQGLENLPPGSKVEMSPISSGLGEIYYFRLDNPSLSLRERRSLMDWVVRPALKTVPGLADVNVWGGEAKQIHVILDPSRVREFSLTYPQLAQAVERNNANGSGSLIRQGPEQQVVRTLGTLQTLEDVRQIVVGQRNSVPLLLGQVGTVQEGSLTRQGAVTANGTGEEVYGIALLLLGENGRVVVERVKERLRQIESALPPGSRLEGFLDRSVLIRATLGTAVLNLVEGGLLVAGLLFLFLLQVRAGLIVSCAIPLSMLTATLAMQYFKISANLMSLGAIDFGLVVDGAVIIVENCLRRLALRRQQKGSELSEEERLEEIRAGSVEVRRATILGEILILSTYLPILSLGGIEGKMFRPMGFTVIFALLGAMICSFTVVPALCAYFLRQSGEERHPVLDPLRHGYERSLRQLLRQPLLVVCSALLITALSGLLLLRLGGDFIPELEEGALAVQVTYPTSISLDEAVRQSGQIEKALRSKFPAQVDQVVTRIGRPEIATDPMLTCQTDVLVDLKPGTYQREKLVEEMSAYLGRSFPELDISYTQPIKMRMMELIEGVGIRSDLGIKLYGSDHAVLAREAKRVAAVVEKVQGAADVQVEITEGLPQLQIAIDRTAIARYGISVDDVNQVVEMLLGGKPITTINDGNQRYDVAFRLPIDRQNDVDTIRRLQIPSMLGPSIPLQQLARIEKVEGLVQISRENGKRRIVIQSNVRGRDLGSFVQEVQRKVNADVKLPVGYYLEYGGTYEKMQSGRARLALVVPLTFALVLGLLYLTFQDWGLAVLICTGIPFAVVGGVTGLWLRSLPVSISALIGFVALAGVAVLNGVVMLTFVTDLRKQGLSAEEAVVQGAVTRLRPVLMTAAVASLGFLPMALSQGSGAEVQRPLATVVLGGVVTSTLLTLLVLPVLYLLLKGRKP